MASTAGVSNLERQIRSQPDVLASMLASEQLRQQIHAAAEGLQRARRIWVVGTGTSAHAASLGATMLQEAGRSAHSVSSMQFVSHAPIVGAQDAVIVVTHTAETAYALAARALAFHAGLDVIMVTKKNSGFPDAIETVELETSETYSVSYTTALLALAMLAGQIGAERFGPEILAAVAPAVREAIVNPGTEAVPVPGRSLVIFGAGPASVTAREGALKVREASRTLAEGYDAEQLLHGAAVPLGSQDHLIALTVPDDDGFVAALALAAEAEGIGVTTLAETSQLPTLLAQIPLTVRLQLLASRLAVARGQDPDKVITGRWDDPNLWAVGKPSAS